ncbi:MAG: class I SAM-dependent methyltransferase [Amylibacter sp.]|nr:class I SAM-dependent methyltransferase [Amylibacter sp.]
MNIFKGWCAVCEQNTEFHSPDEWFRDHLLCQSCGSLPRERAFFWALTRFYPEWKSARLHEGSPGPRRVSLRLQQECKRYIGSHFYPDIARGKSKNGFQSEDMEALTFKDGSIDLHCHLDVLEHVNRPNQCFKEIARTLAPAGLSIFTTPIYKDLSATERKAIYFQDGVEHLCTPEYHGNPIDDQGSLVTFHYGQNFSDLIKLWAPSLSVCRIDLGAVLDNQL